MLTLLDEGFQNEVEEPIHGFSLGFQMWTSLILRRCIATSNKVNRYYSSKKLLLAMPLLLLAMDLLLELCFPNDQVTGVIFRSPLHTPLIWQARAARMGYL